MDRNLASIIVASLLIFFLIILSSLLYYHNKNELIINAVRDGADPVHISVALSLY